MRARRVPSGGFHIALVGCGRWGRNILRDLLALGCQVTVVDGSAERRDEALMHGAGTALEAIDLLGPADGCIVATPASTHAAVVQELVHRRVPIFVEKPLTTEPRSAVQLATFSDRLFVMDKWRYHPAIQEIGRIVRSREFGPVVSLHTVRLGSEHHDDVDAIWTLAPHDLSIALEVLGALAQPVSASAEWQAGDVALSAQLGHDPVFVMRVGAAPGERVRRVVLGCEGAMVVLDSAENPFLEIRGGKGVIERRSVQGTQPLYAELAAFIAYLRGGPAPVSSAAEGAAVVQMIANLRRMAGLDPGKAG
jgi:predicted dehydrogenase